MPLSKQQTEEISIVLTNMIRQKLAVGKKKSNVMPFQVRLLGKDRVALFSFIHSINTSLGQDFFEDTAMIVARPHFARVVKQYSPGKAISSDAQRVIQTLIDGLANGRMLPNKANEVSQVLAVARSGTTEETETPLVDLFLESSNGDEYYIELKTVKPNKEDFKGFKKTLLDWVAIRGKENPAAKIHTLLAFAYNPNDPKPYHWMTSAKMLDGKNDLLVAEEFWNFLGGENTYQNLLDVFEQVGIALRPEIDAKFAKLN